MLSAFSSQLGLSTDLLNNYEYVHSLPGRTSTLDKNLNRIARRNAMQTQNTELRIQNTDTDTKAGKRVAT